MNLHLIGRVGIIALVAAIAFLTARQESGPVWGAVSAVAIGGGVALAVFYDDGRRFLRGRSAHGSETQ